MGNGYKWFRSVCGETVNDAKPIEVACGSHEEAAEEAADAILIDECGTWLDGFRAIDIVGPDGTVRRYKVTIEWSPTFSAQEVANG